MTQPITNTVDEVVESICRAFDASDVFRGMHGLTFISWSHGGVPHVRGHVPYSRITEMVKEKRNNE